MRASTAKAKARREWRDWWLAPQAGATPPAPKATRQATKRTTVDPDRPVPKGKRQRLSARQDTDPAAPERETLAWVGHSDLSAQLDDGSAPDDFGYDDAGFPVNVPDRPQPDQAPPPRDWWGSTDESAGFHTGPASNNQGVRPMSTTDTPPDVATVESARATYLHNAEDANRQAVAYAAEGQTARDQANVLVARNDTGEHNGEIARLNAHADGCEANSGLRAAQADAWTQEAATAFDRIKEMMSGG